MPRTTKNKIVYEENINNIHGKAASICFPESIQEIKQAVKLVNGGSDIVPRGSGTSFTGGVIPQNSVILDFSKMNKIIEIDAGKKIAVVEPGVLLSELNEELEQYGLEFPIIPLFSGIETIGGMIAKNSAGNREIKYGRMLNWIDRLYAVDGKGEHIRVSKSDLGDFVGLEGTTGAIVQAILRLTAKKPKTLTILKARTLTDVFITNRKLRLKQDVCSIDLVNPTISALLGLENKYHIFVEFESSEGYFKGADYEKFIKLKNSAYKKTATEGNFIYMSNAKFLVDSLQDFLMHLEERKIPYIAHLASGIVYPLFKPEQVDLINETAKIAKRLRGRIAYNFGIGMTKKEFVEHGESEIIARIKKRHDPYNKFNRNKLITYLPIIEKIEKIEKAGEKTDEAEESKEAQEVQEKAEEKFVEVKEEAEEETEKAEEQKNQETAQSLINTAETTTLKKNEPELSPEEKEKIKKIAFGLFAGSRDQQENKE